ncbi:MAG: helix-turn-helix transcriptional regulator, partial [Alphaproteobacteria bacterium]|nr:helix-turn-helix transcriptional regulator [Alphaproteobacteria bacterium]
MITGRQIRAGRSLLDWDAEDLAAQAGLSRDTVFNIEKGVVQARGGSMEKIVQAFSNNGVEFTDNQGVRFKPTGIDIYDGAENFDRFYDFLYNHLKQNGGEVCLSIYDETLPTKHRRNPELHRNHMKELVDRGDVTFRVLTTKSDFVSYGYVKFKWQPQQSATPTGFYAFGDCLALLSFVNPSSPYIVVIQSGPLTEAYRQGFNIAWNNAEEPPH